MRFHEIWVQGEFWMDMIGQRGLYNPILLPCNAITPMSIGQDTDATGTKRQFGNKTRLVHAYVT